MYNRLVFFNEFGAGDVWESREFVKEIMKIIPAKEYFYSHGKNPRILLDLPELKFLDFDRNLFNSMEDVIQLPDNSLGWNTWIGRDGQYVLPGIGCTPEQLLRMHNDMLRRQGLGQLPGNPINYIPDINYYYYDIDPVDEFMNEHPEEKIFIDNGNVQSMQAENFPMEQIIYKLADEYKDKCFIVTHKLSANNVEGNIFSTDSIIKSSHGFDLNEISYLSTFCTTLVGRNSGPHVFSQVKKNCMDESKRLVSFTYKITGASFVINTPVKLEKFWSDATDEENVILAMREILK